VEARLESYPAAMRDAGPDGDICQGRDQQVARGAAYFFLHDEGEDERGARVRGNGSITL